MHPSVLQLKKIYTYSTEMLPLPSNACHLSVFQGGDIINADSS